MDPSNFFRTETDLALGEARREKAALTKNQGSPIELAGKPIKIEVRGENLWTAESGGLVRKYSLESGKLLQSYKGHTGPVTCLAFLPSTNFMFTGSWDKSIKVWNTIDRSLLSSVNAHSDFLKCLLVIPQLSLLISGGSDKAIRFWDLGGLRNSGQLTQIGVLTDHTRPVGCLCYDADNTTATTSIIFSADSMGVIKVWNLVKKVSPEIRCYTALKNQLSGHSTGINDMWFGLDQLWTSSTDGSVIVHDVSSENSAVKRHKLFELRNPVKSILPLSLTLVNEPLLVVGSGDTIFSYDVSSLDRPEGKGVVDGHWHDIMALRLWVKKANTPSGFEPMIISASLDGTVRKWSLKEILSPLQQAAKGQTSNAVAKTHGITDAELDELLDSGEE